MDGERLRILHLTDLHMRQALVGTADRPERLSRDIPGLLERLGDRLSEWAPDIVIMTGDLLDVPDEVVDGSLVDISPDAYAEAVDHSTKDYRWMRDWLESLGCDWLVIPGNHDHRGAFCEVFSTTTFDTTLQGWRFIGFDDDLDDRRAPVRSETETERLRSVLEAAESDVPQIHLQHYSIRPRIHRRTPYSYDADAGISSLIEQNAPVRGVLSGHYHPGAFCRSANDVAYSTGPAFCQTPFPFRIMDLSTNRVTAVTDYCLD